MRVSLIVLYSSDLGASRAFFEVLGFSFTPEKHGSGPEHFSARLDDLVLELYPARASEPAGSSAMIGLAFEDPAIPLEELVDRGFCPAEKLAAIGERPFVIVAEPGGNRVLIEASS